MGPGDHIRRGSAADLPRLEPLWVSVHRAHIESMPELAPYVDDATTWAPSSSIVSSRHFVTRA